MSNERVDEIWENISKLSAGRVRDNELTKKAGEKYPLSIRIQQTYALRSLISELDIIHNRMKHEASETDSEQ